MPYTTETDITDIEITRDELIALTDDEKLGVVNSTRVTAAILKADAEIDGYCQQRYTVPFSPVPDEIKFISTTLAAYWLWRRRQKVSNSMLDKYTKALARLKAISRGDYSIPGVTALASGLASTIDASAVQTFTRTKKDKDGNVIGDAGSMETW